MASSVPQPSKTPPQPKQEDSSTLSRQDTLVLKDQPTNSEPHRLVPQRVSSVEFHDLCRREQLLTKQLRALPAETDDFEVLRRLAHEREDIRAKITALTATHRGRAIMDNDQFGRVVIWNRQRACEEFSSKTSFPIPELVRHQSTLQYPIDTNWWGNFEWRDRVQHVLQDRFRYTSLRLLQYPVINCILAGHNCLVLMPTGGGKSLCYQIPALLRDGVTFVVSPLISLMADQVSALAQKGIPSLTCNSQMPENYAMLKRDVEAGTERWKIVYITPEAIEKSGTLEEILRTLDRKGRLALLVVDEAHCISQWGHDFRQSYQHIRTLRKSYPRVQTVFFTATATRIVTNDILLSTGNEKAVIFSQTFNRPNLFYEVRPKQANFVDQHIGEILLREPGTAIVFCFSRADCDELGTYLLECGVGAGVYHAGLAKDERVAVQRRWMNGEISVIVATVAFGMGIDKPDVRLVIHRTIPASVEQYFQESGRAGRDGQPSRCILFYSPDDIQRIEWLKSSGTPRALSRKDRENIAMIQRYCTSRTCRRVFQLNYFGESFAVGDCTGCDVCAAAARGGR